MAIHAHSIPAPALHRALLRDARLLTPGDAALPVSPPILTAETVAMLDEIPQDDADLLAAFEHDFAALIAQPWPEMPPEPLLPAESTGTTANDASALASESASESTAPLLPLPAPLPSLTAALSRRRAIFGAGTKNDLPATARALHMRHALEAALDHGMALLEALGLPAVSPAIDRAIRTLDALDAPGEDMEDGDDVEQDRADEELSLGWTTSVSQVNLGDNADDGEEDDPAEDDATSEPDEGAWESQGPHDQRRWCAQVTPPTVYSMRVQGDCCEPMIPDGAHCIVDSEAAFGPGDFVVIHHDDPAAEGGIASKVKQLAHDIEWWTFPVISEVELLPVISARMLNPPRGICFDARFVHAVHKVVEIERPQVVRA